eukprot:Skav209997  [mRNA]  locus=scaffold3061:82816:87975:+ [translate_table: standard]
MGCQPSPALASPLGGTFGIREDGAPRAGGASTDVFTKESSSSNSIAWADFACVDGKINHPFAHCCPAKHLSINMVVAFVLEYHAAGPWKVVNDKIDFDYYGTTEGFKCIKVVP